MNALKHVYFIKPIGMIGPIKIGCSRFVEDRLITLSLWSPIPLEIVYSEVGDHQLERRIHRCFSDLHSHHEWFHAGERLLRAVERLKAGETIHEAIDLDDDRGSIFKHGTGSKPCKPGMEGYRSYCSRIRHAEAKASAVTGDHMRTPRDVDEIMKRWLGLNGWKQPKTPSRPTEAEFARLEEVINFASEKMIPFLVKHPKPSLVA